MDFKVLYPQHLFASPRGAPARAKHRVRRNYMVTHVTFAGNGAHPRMKCLPTYLADHMLLWLTIAHGPTAERWEEYKAYKRLTGKENGAFRRRKGNLRWLPIFSQKSQKTRTEQKNTHDILLFRAARTQAQTSAEHCHRSDLQVHLLLGCSLCVPFHVPCNIQYLQKCIFFVVQNSG